MTLLASFRPYASHDGNREALVRRQAAEPHLEDGGIYLERWWSGRTEPTTTPIHERPGRSASAAYSRRSGEPTSAAPAVASAAGGPRGWLAGQEPLEDAEAVLDLVRCEARERGG